MLAKPDEELPAATALPCLYEPKWVRPSTSLDVRRCVMRAAGSGRLGLDGGLGAFDDRGLSGFERLQERMHVRDRDFGLYETGGAASSVVVMTGRRRLVRATL